jgi:ubiquinone/menaquinone biosynthesis C-methylase UbiE
MPGGPRSGSLPFVRRHPIFARFYERLSKAMDPIEREHREEVTRGATGRVLEVGVGNGLNLEHYREAGSVVGVEPEPTMIDLARPRVLEAAVPVRMVRARAERLPFRDGAFDTVVVSLVFCSVDKPSLAAAEIRRVLRPGGTLRFWEHVRSSGRVGAAVQDLATAPWKAFAGGCHPNRDTVRTLRRSGFEVEARRFPLGPPTPARPHVIGVARPG